MIWTLLLISCIAMKNVQPYLTRPTIHVPDSIQQIPESFPAVEYPSSILDAARPFFFQSQNLLSPFPCDVQASYKSLGDLKDSCSRKTSICPLLENKGNSKPMPVCEIKSNSTPEELPENVNIIPETTIQNELSTENVEPNTLPLDDIANVLPIGTVEPVANLVPLGSETPDGNVIPLETENPATDIIPLETEDPATNYGQLDSVNPIPNIVPVETENPTSDIAPVANNPAETGIESLTNIVPVQNDDIVSEDYPIPVANELSDSGVPPIDALPMSEDSSTVVVDQIESVSKEIIPETPIEPASALNPDKTLPTI